MKKIILSLFIAASALAAPAVNAAGTFTSLSAVSQQTDDIDKTLNQYDRFVTRLSKLVDRAFNGDMQAITDLQSLAKEGEKLASKLEKMKDDMNEEQTKRFNDISLRLMEVYEKVSNS